MNFPISALSPIIMIATLLIFDFNAHSDLTNWTVVDDVVMGGRSGGTFSINSEGHGVFKGSVSLENNGGFSSVRYRFDTKMIQGYSKLIIRLKGDGKRYQLRVKANTSDYHSYIGYLATTDDWQQVEIPLADLYPSFRGRKLDLPNYPGEKMEEIAFLSGNKKAEDFQLEIDKISLK